MAEEQKSPAAPVSAAVPEGAVSPPVHSVTRFNITSGSSEILLTFGVQRAVIDSVTGNPSPKLATEWLFSVGLNPVVAKQLHQFLTLSIQGYEALFGAIPVDPANQAQLQKFAEAQAVAIAQHKTKQ